MAETDKFEFHQDGVPLSGRVRAPSGRPQGIVVAFHGGNTVSRYWDSPLVPEDSLLQVGASLGWRVIAFDRPGHGASSSYSDGFGTREQARLLTGATAELNPEGLPVMLVGHSLGTIVVAQMAATAPPEDLLAVAVGGMPIRFSLAQTERMAGVDTSRPSARTHRRLTAEVMYGPTHTWDPRIRDFRAELVGKTPRKEYDDARSAPRILPGLLRQVRVPTQVAVAEFEQATAPADEALVAAVEALSAAPYIEEVIVPSGHNLSLGHFARYYHSRVIAFAERALGTRGRAQYLIPPRPPPARGGGGGGSRAERSVTGVTPAGRNRRRPG